MKKKVSKNVFWLGLVSCFNDIASEMAYPIIPLFLTNVLGAPVSIVGIIEGIAEATASILKSYFGWLSDAFGRRKPFTVIGYSVSTLSKLLLALSFSWPFVLVARFFDRFGKGIRTPARDALICESSDKSDRGIAFGFHRALDSLGAVIGPLFAFVAMSLLSGKYRLTFLLSFIPAVIGVLLLIFFVEEKKKTVPSFCSVKANYAKLNMEYYFFLVISLLFSIGNSSDAFLILRAQNLGLSASLVVLAYMIFNISYSLFSTPIGFLSDKIGHKNTLILSFALFSFIYYFFGFANSVFYVWILFPLYGIFMSLNEGISKAYISTLIENEYSGTGLGIFYTSTGIFTLFSSIIAGLLWSFYGPSSPFYFGSITALLSCFLLLFFPKFLIKTRNFS